MPVSTSNMSWTPDPNLVFAKLDEREGVLLHLETKRYFSLNGTGMRIWGLLEAEHPPAEIAATLAEEYTVDRGEARQYVQHFLDELREEALVDPVAE